MNVFKTAKFWFENARYHAVAQSLWAAVTAVCVALNHSSFNLKYSVLAVIGVIFAHLSINLLDDYFDFKIGSVDKRNELGNSIRKGKCKYLTEGKTTPKQLFACACIFGLIALILGGILFYYRGLPILIIASIAIILGFFYSAPPLKLSYNGFGELVVGLMFGPLLMNGVFYCATGTISLQLLLLSFAVGSLVTNIVYVHSIMDMKADGAVGKKTLAVLLKKNYFRLTALVFFAIYPYWIIGTGILRYKMPELLWFVFLTLPLTAVLVKFMVEYVNGIKKEHQPKFWMGQFECWDRIKSIGIEWFMIRWFLARNIMVFFSMIICAAYIVTAIN